MNTESLREELADLQHQQWSGWMEYLFSKCRPNPEVADELIIPAWAVMRWLRQSQTFYKNLPEEEKESDRIEADKYLPIIAQQKRQAQIAVLEDLKKSSDHLNPAHTHTSEKNWTISVDNIDAKIAELNAERSTDVS